MKTKAIISSILFIFLLQGVAISQTAKSKKAEKSAQQFLKESQVELQLKQKQLEHAQLDSLIRSSGRAFAAPNAVWSRAQDAYFGRLDNSSRSSLSFRKEFREKKSITRSYDMEFTKDNKSMTINISAEAREGNVQIVIVKPNGKNFKVLEVEDMESLEWGQTINAYTDDNKKEYEGKWQVKVVVKDARGYYNIRLNTK